VNEYFDWVQYSSYANGAFRPRWRGDFDATTLPAGWAVGNWASPYNLSTHNPANVNCVNGVAVLSMTADDATGYSDTPPADTDGGAAVSPTDAGAAQTSTSGGGCGCDSLDGDRARVRVVAGRRDIEGPAGGSAGAGRTTRPRRAAAPDRTTRRVRAAAAGAPAAPPEPPWPAAPPEPPDPPVPETPPKPCR
jgi:hypothetical protein